MEWVRLYATPSYYHDGAIQRAGEAAEVLFTRALAFCGNSETRGRVDKAVLPLICATKPQVRAAALVREGLWTDEGDHYIIRSWEKLQDAHDAAAVKKQQDRDRQRAKRQRDRDALRDGPPDPEDTSRDSHADGHVMDGDNHAVEVDGDVEVVQKTCSPAAPSSVRGVVPDRDALFAEWWDEYPRKQSKPAAKKMYMKSLKVVSAQTLLDAVRRYASDPNLPEKVYIPYPGTWLNDERWNDGPLPAQAKTVNRDAQGRVCPPGQESLPTYERFRTVTL